jgi:hypothetical protein
VPVNAIVVFDRDRRVARLAWQPGKDGTAPARFRIYGSSERGFTANDKPYEYDAGLDGIRQAPANLLVETHGALLTAELPADLWRAYYRLVAVDAEGRVSGPSDIAEMPHPVIVTRMLPPAARMRFYSARILTNASIGHLVSADEDGKQYQYRYRTGDDLVFSLAGAPAGLSIDSTGLISGFIDERANSSYELTVEVKNKTDGKSDAVTLVLQVSGKRP